MQLIKIIVSPRYIYIYIYVLMILWTPMKSQLSLYFFGKTIFFVYN